MSNLVKLVEALEDKIGKLVEKQSQSTHKIAKLERDLELSGAEVNNLQKHIEALEAKNQTLKTANAMLGSNEYKKETKLKINSLMREIDQCIVHLSE